MAPATQAVKFTRPTGSAMVYVKNATTQKELARTHGETNTLNNYYKRPSHLARSSFFAKIFICVIFNKIPLLLYIIT